MSCRPVAAPAALTARSHGSLDRSLASGVGDDCSGSGTVHSGLVRGSALGVDGSLRQFAAVHGSLRCRGQSCTSSTVTCLASLLAGGRLLYCAAPNPLTGFAQAGCLFAL